MSPMAGQPPSWLQPGSKLASRLAAFQAAKQKEEEEKDKADEQQQKEGGQKEIKKCSKHNERRGWAVAHPDAPGLVLDLVVLLVHVELEGEVALRVHLARQLRNLGGTRRAVSELKQEQQQHQHEQQHEHQHQPQHQHRSRR